MSTQKTSSRLDELLEKVRNHRLLAAAIFFGVAIVGIASVLSSLDSIVALGKKWLPGTKPVSFESKGSDEGGSEGADLSPGPVSLFVMGMMSDDGGTQLPFVNCIHGQLFATPEIEQLHRLPEELYHAEDIAWLGPVSLVLDVDTNIPSEDYVKLLRVEVAVLEYFTLPSRPDIVVGSSVCANGIGGYPRYHFLAILPPRKQTFDILPSDSTPPLVVEYTNPASLFIEFRARAVGWYRVGIEVIYRYRSQEFSARLPKPVNVYWPGPGRYEWFFEQFDEPFLRIPEEDVEKLRASLHRWSERGFPPAPVEDSERSGWHSYWLGEKKNPQN